VQSRSDKSADAGRVRRSSARYISHNYEERGRLTLRMVQIGLSFTFSRHRSIAIAHASDRYRGTTRRNDRGRTLMRAVYRQRSVPRRVPKLPKSVGTLGIRSIRDCRGCNSHTCAIPRRISLVVAGTRAAPPLPCRLAVAGACADSLSITNRYGVYDSRVIPVIALSCTGRVGNSWCARSALSNRYN